MTLVPAALERRDDRFRAAISAIDEANADDPETIVIDGRERPKEQAHAELACDWVLTLDPDASDEQLLAARAHHLRRWELARAEYPDGRAGYLRWRTDQKKRHAAAVGKILADVGYGPEVAERVGSIIRKQRLTSDVDVQTHEDALCLVFLSTQFGPVADQLGADKTVDVLAKTMQKMSTAGIAAVGSLDLDDRESELVRQAAVRLAQT